MFSLAYLFDTKELIIYRFKNAKSGYLLRHLFGGLLNYQLVRGFCKVQS